MTVNEIAVQIKSNWDTVSTALDLLKSLGLVESEGEGNKTMFKAKVDNTLFLRKDTVFGLPIIRYEDENLCKMLFMKLREKWYDKHKSFPNKTQMQKMLVKVADNLNLSIPRGWYLFGKMAILQYDPDMTYVYDNVNIPNLDKTLSESVTHISKYKKTLDIEYDQYKNNPLYLTKFKIREVLTKYQFNKETTVILSNLLYTFAMNIKCKEDNGDIVKNLNAFVSVANQLLFYKSQEELENVRELLIDSFASIWELIAIYNLFDSLVEGNFGYERQNLRKYFERRIDTLSAISWDYIAELDGTINKKVVLGKDSTLLKFKGVLFNPKRISKEEKKELFKEFSSNKSDIFREFDL
jgi:DNA-binding transcriptional ArsR family regulator